MSPQAPAPLTAWAGVPLDGGHLQAGSDPHALPGPVLVADKKNNRLLIIDPQGRIRWQWPQPGDLLPGQTFSIPDDAFFSPDGGSIVATQEDDQVISVISLASRRLTYRYGHPGVAGHGDGYLHNPDDALLLPDGRILTADIKNCRLLILAPPAQAPAQIFGRTTRACRHDPPARWGSPNGAFPMRDGNYLVTEINGDWVDELSLNGTVSWSTHPPQVHYPSDTNEIAPGRYLTVDYSARGQLVIFDRAGDTLYRYAPTAPGPALDHPSLALPLPNGDVLVNDDYNDRVVVIDPAADKIVWQYGHTGVPGSAPGYLDNPDGVDLAAPHNLLHP